MNIFQLSWTIFLLTDAIDNITSSLARIWGVILALEEILLDSYVHVFGGGK